MYALTLARADPQATCCNAIVQHSMHICSHERTAVDCNCAPDCSRQWKPHAILCTPEACMLCAVADAVGQLLHEGYVALSKAKNWPELDGFELATHDYLCLNWMCPWLA